MKNRQGSLPVLLMQKASINIKFPKIMGIATVVGQWYIGQFEAMQKVIFACMHACITAVSIKEEHVYPEICVLEDHAIKRHAVGGLLDASELQKGIVLALKLSTFPMTKGREVSVWNHVLIKDMILKS